MTTERELNTALFKEMRIYKNGKEVSKEDYVFDPVTKSITFKEPLKSSRIKQIFWKKNKQGGTND